VYSERNNHDMSSRRSRPWYVSWDSLWLSASSSVTLSFLVVSSLFFSTEVPSHHHWWYWPLLIATIGYAAMSIASTAWFIRDRIRVNRANEPQQLLHQ